VRIALVGDLEDLSNAYFAWVARERGAEVVELAEDRLGEAWSFRVEGGGGRLELGGEPLPFEALDGAFVRLNPAPALPEALAGLPDELARSFTLERRYGLHHLLDALPCPVVNRPSAGRSNSSKPFQMDLLAAGGLEVPPWRVTNRRADAEAFVASRPEGAIYKACSGLRSEVRRVDDALLGRLDASCPVLLQEYVPGIDVRIHTVGERSFASRIDSTGIDYRFADSENRYSAIGAPAGVAARCLEVARREGLLLAGFDFRVHPDGRWLCLEVNPVPTFLPYEAAAGHPIADTVLEHMAALGGRALPRLEVPARRFAPVA
jgi:hypothetical protein